MTENHLADVQRYDATADAETVDRIIKHLGVALRNPKSVSVHCAGPKDARRIRDSWCDRKLGIKDGQISLRAIDHVVETMQHDGEMKRVTFYYLVAKQLGRVDAI